METKVLKLLLGKLILLSSLTVHAEEAIDKALEAAYRQTGIRKMVNTKLKKLERIYIPNYIKPYMGTAFAIGKAINDKQIKAKISNEWSAELTFREESKYTVTYLWKF